MKNQQFSFKILRHFLIAFFLSLLGLFIIKIGIADYVIEKTDTSLFSFVFFFMYLGVYINGAYFTGLNFIKLSTGVLNLVKNKYKIPLSIIISIIPLIVLSQTWYLGSENVLNAIIYEVKNYNYIGYLIISFIIWHFSKERILDYNHKVNPKFNYTVHLNFICFLFFIIEIYYSFGLDDGCTMVDGDPMFGGGYLECDDEYIKDNESILAITENNNFNPNALRFSKFLINTLTGYLIFWIFISYHILKAKYIRSKK